MDDYLKASKEGLKIVKDAGYRKGWKQTVTQEWWVRANTSQATLKRFWLGKAIDGSAFRGICAAVGVEWKKVVEPDGEGEIMVTELNIRDRLEEPEGLVVLKSAFYVERPPVEERCFEAIARKGALIRIKAPRQMGKSSLMIRILDRAKQHGCQPVTLNFQRADNALFGDLDKFLRWFCASIGQHLGLPIKFDEYWDDDFFTSKDNCTNYFQSYLLAETASPIALALDEVDLIFQHEAIAADFFGLLRFWHEEAKSGTIWEKLRLLVVHSQEVYIPLDINQSPFNVGVPIELLEFNRSQIQELATRHGLLGDDREISELMAMVGGHPYLVRVALYHTARQYISLPELLQNAPTDAGYYSDHLARHLGTLENNQTLAAAMRQVVWAENPVRLAPKEAFKLDSMGLVQRQGNDVLPRCELYRLYFRDRLGV